MKNRLLSVTTKYILVSWITVFAVLPLLLIFALSFFSNNPNSLFSLPLTFKNFNILFDGYFYKILGRSFLLSIYATLVCFIIAYPFSYFLSLKKNTKLLLVMILIPFWTSSLIRTYSMIGLLKTKGLLNMLLLKLQLINHPLDLLYNQAAVVIGLSYNLLPFMILPLYNTFEKFDDNLIKAAQDLNASNFYIFRKIIWPLSWPGVKNSLIMVLFPAMTIFYIPNILGGAKSILLGNLIENQFFVLDNWPGGSATSLFLSLFMIFGLFLTQYKRNEK